MPEFPATKTTMTPAEVADAVRTAWGPVFALDPVDPPSPDCVALVVAHSALETAFWHSMYCYDFGNAKSAGKVGNWCFYPCGENLENAAAKRYVAADPAHASIAPGQNPDAAILAVNFLPPHPMCRFMAFTSATEGMAAHLRMLRSVFPKVLPSLFAGEARAYAKALKANGYYTAGEAGYEEGLVRCLAQVKKILGVVDPPPAPVQAPAVPPPVATAQSDVPKPAADGSTVGGSGGLTPTQASSEKKGTVVGAAILLCGIVAALISKHC